MATNIKGTGDVLYLVAPPGGVTAGTPVIIGGSFVLPLVTAAAGVSFACTRGGQWYLTKATGFAPAAGAAAYWDSTSEHVEGTDASDNRRIGVFAKAAANGALVCYVIPDGVSFGDGNTDLEAKADKVSGAVSGNFAGLNASGNLTDSGSKAADFAAAAHAATHITGGGDTVASAVSGGAAGLMTGADKTLLDAVVADFISAKAIISGDGNFAPAAFASITADLPDAATTRAIAFPVGGGTWLLVDVDAVKTGGAGGSGGAQTLTIQSGANPITDAYDFQAVADNVPFDFPNSLDDAYTTFTDAGVLNMVTTKTGNSACRVTCIFQRIA
jgi:predicted RecA/RadA family phage recombinase